MVDTAVQTHLERLGKPLHYAMRHNFAHLAKLRDVESYLQHHVQALQALALPEALCRLLQQFAQSMHGFDALPLPHKQMRLGQAYDLLAQLHTALSTPAQTTASPAASPRTKHVLPLPSGPSRQMTSPPLRRRASAAASSRVSASLLLVRSMVTTRAPTRSG